MPEKPKFVVASDFDGFITDVNKGAKNFYSAYIDSFSRRLDIHPNMGKLFMNTGLRKVLSEPGVHGWEIDGKVVSAAESDPYQLTKAAAQESLKMIRERTNFSLPAIEETPDFLDAIFHDVYPHAGIHFKEGALEYIESLQTNPDIELVFVTNSDTKAVRKKLNKLFEEEGSKLKADDIKIVGNAKKEIVGDETVKTEIDGMPRPVYADREQYIRTLRDIGADVVLGDNIEMDILPAALIGLNAIWMDTTADDPIVLDENIEPIEETENNLLAAQKQYLEGALPDQVQIISSLGQAVQAIIQLAKKE